MINLFNIHGTCVVYQDKGILFIGKSGSGKSDIALRMIMNKDAKLLADDRVDIREENDSIIASPPPAILGMMEVRGIGLCRFEPVLQAKISLVVELVEDRNQITRLPSNQYYQIMGVDVPQMKIYPFDASSIDKVILACCQNQ